MANGIDTNANVNQHDERAAHMIDAAALAAELDVNRASIYRKAACGELPHVRLGRAIRFHLPSVLKALAGRKDTLPRGCDVRA